MQLAQLILLAIIVAVGLLYMSRAWLPDTLEKWFSLMTFYVTAGVASIGLGVLHVLAVSGKHTVAPPARDLKYWGPPAGEEGIAPGGWGAFIETAVTSSPTDVKVIVGLGCLTLFCGGVTAIAVKDSKWYKTADQVFGILLGALLTKILV